MKRILLGLLLISTTAVVYASCLTNVIVNKDGSHTICITCCTDGNCQTTCM